VAVIMGLINMGYFKNLSIKQMNDERAEEFLRCIGRGKSIYECEGENDNIKLNIRYLGKKEKELR